MRFKCEARYIDLNNFPMEFATDVDGEPEMVHSGAVVHFNVDIDAREHGIKEIVTHANIIKLSVGDYELCIHKLSPSTIDGNNDDQWEVLEYVDFTNKQVYPERVELDWERKIAEVYFA
jgi:hypothetical protein